MKFLAMTFALALATGATLAPTEPVAPAQGDADAAAIYTAFLKTWNGKEHYTLNVSKSAELPTREERSDYAKCVKEGGDGTVEWTNATAIPDLSSAIGNLEDVKFVDPKQWKPQDPGELIAQGKSVESSVDAGFAAGLLSLSAITFDKSHATAALTYSFVCGGLCGNGGSLIFKKTAKGWEQANYACGSWISGQPKIRPTVSWRRG